jgi:hypothetical protein
MKSIIKNIKEQLLVIKHKQIKFIRVDYLKILK